MSLIGLTTAQIKQIETDFQAAPGRGFLEDLAPLLAEAEPEERLCLQFLYAYMPASDCSSYPPAFFQKAVRDTLNIRYLLHWSLPAGEAAISGEMFLNYVLPLRLNNENLTDHRERFFRELYPRVKGLSIGQAALEVNYWCLENATYRSTDDRTYSPLSVLLNAAGRCGEESVLCTAALRSVGIPARQCYTPRWAHCDDNHAWVEVWDGERFIWMGACEPEPLLGRGWFVETSKRGMLIHARAFTNLISEPEVVKRTPILAEVNILSHYAPVKRLEVTVKQNGLPCEGALVGFFVINYAELYSIREVRTGEDGKASFLTGFGDLYVQVNKDGRFLFRKAPGDATALSVAMEDAYSILEDQTEELTLIPPPPALGEEPAVSQAIMDRHQNRIAHANACRKARMDTFLNGGTAKASADGFPAFRDEIATFLEQARGNWPEILRFLEDEEFLLKDKVTLLSVLREKDLTDSGLELLKSHLRGALPYEKDGEEERYAKYILCPRVENEWLTSYREPIATYFSKPMQIVFQREPRKIQTWIEENVADCGDRDYETISSAPAGLLKSKFGSALSRKILFVAVCRTFGIPARLSPVDRSPEYWADGWQRGDTAVEDTVVEDTVVEDAAVEDAAVEVASDRRATLTLCAQPSGRSFIYRKNFTVARQINGVYQTLGLDVFPLKEGKVSYALEEGAYRVLTANRQPDGSVLAELTHITLKRGASKEVMLRLSTANIHEEEGLCVPDGLFKSRLESGSPCVLAFVETGKEPTEHLLNELLEQAEEFSASAKRLLFAALKPEDLEDPLFCAAREAVGFQTAFADGNAYEEMRRALPGNPQKLPLILELDGDGKCARFISGYHVGAGDRVLRHICGESNI